MTRRLYAADLGYGYTAGCYGITGLIRPRYYTQLPPPPPRGSTYLTGWLLLTALPDCTGYLFYRAAVGHCPLPHTFIYTVTRCYTRCRTRVRVDLRCYFVGLL